MASAELAVRGRPVPPADLLALHSPDEFRPAPEVAEWFRETILLPSGPLHNPDHQHLLDAEIGVLWTNVRAKQMMAVAGTMEIPQPISGNQWQRARYHQQIREWFRRDKLDFLMTLSAAFCRETSDAGFCALIEHELYHGAQKRDRDGQLAFSEDSGRPLYALRGHDVEEHLGVVRRYGAINCNVAELVRLANQAPQIEAAQIEFACGTCRR